MELNACGQMSYHLGLLNYGNNKQMTLVVVIEW